MLKRILLSALLLISGTASFAQRPNEVCRRIYDRAVGYFNGNHFQEALKCLAAIKVLDETWKPIADKLILDVYNRVDSAKTQADTAAAREKRQRDIATRALADARINLSKAIGISALENIREGNKLKAKALLETISQEQLPVSEEVYCARLGFAEPLLHFDKKIRVATGFDNNFANRISGLVQANDGDLFSVVNDDRKLSFIDMAGGALVHYPLVKACGIIKAKGEAIYQSQTGELCLPATGNKALNRLVKVDEPAVHVLANAARDTILVQDMAGRLLRYVLSGGKFLIADTIMSRSANDFDIDNSGSVLAATNIGSSLIVWRGGQKTTFQLDSILRSLNLEMRHSHPLVKLSPDGRFAAVVMPTTDTSHTDSYLTVIYNSSTGHSVSYLISHFDVGIERDDFTFSPVGDELLVNQHTGVTLLNPSTGTVNMSMNIPSASYSFHPQGGLLAIADKNEVKIYDTRTRALVERITNGKKAVTSVCFDHSGNYLISTDLSGFAKRLQLVVAEDPGYAIRPTQYNQRHFFSEDGRYYIACQVVNLVPIQWGLFLYDRRQDKLSYLMTLSSLPGLISFKDPSKVFIVDNNKVIGMNFRDFTRLLTYNAPGRIEAAAVDNRRAKIWYLSQDKLYCMPLTATGAHAKPVPVDGALRVEKLIVSSQSGGCLLLGTRNDQRENVMVEVQPSGKSRVTKLPAEPLAAFYDAQDRPMLLARDKLLRLNPNGVWKATALSTAIPMFVYNESANNFSGRDFIILPRTSGGTAALNLLYISTLTGFTTELDNPAAARYASGDNTFTNMVIGDHGELLTLSNKGYLQLWGKPFTDPKIKTERETNLTVVGSVAVPIQ
jgi:WD40 repeat protein